VLTPRAYARLGHAAMEIDSRVARGSSARRSYDRRSTSGAVGRARRLLFEQ
jgi:hypothetical protein